MSPIQQTILEKLQTLPPEKQEKVLHFVESLTLEISQPCRPTLEGLWEGLTEDITAAEIVATRQET